MESKMLIGQFANTTGISKRMLRHYDKMDLIKPLIIDESNGYRYYSIDQIPLLKTIITLGKYGFTLSEIKALLSEPITKSTFLSKLKDKEVTIRHDIDEQVTHLVNIQRSISYLEETEPGLQQLIDIQSLTLERSPTMKENNTNTIESIRKQISALPTAELFFEKLDVRLKKDETKDKFFITFDLDKFAVINDDYGYDVGDSVIFSSFNIMLDGFSDMITAGHCQPCRFGGDELAFYVEDALEVTVTRIVENILEQIRNHDYSQYGCMRQMTSSCGIYVFKKTVHVQEPRHHSALALIEAKRLGKDCIVRQG